MTERILFVCLGNICRSPTAEAVMRRMAGEAGLRLTLDSAGTGDWHLGEPPYGAAQAAAARRGYDLSPLRARRAVAQDFERFDLILGMDADNVAALERLRPPGNATALRLMLDYAPQAGLRDVPDPYLTRDFDHTLDLLEAASRGLLDQLRAAAPPA
ncbi:phosphotyrosine protein phosphatase [Maritimibacter sp. 55A14]|uniref:low molecular weight protein-tyrosine-phosphatase n=1 Tax=Maritimibacter sp. 55A14 TaxID=2174844 RepID=UPI000D621B20|nr:low molecular weight protein-tyrosine-phosphatase [Maritimibacter sp. 55A14]PWE32027.1 phosphotyrosine protein phosphatase [Maritimibacter sp. 55A14]